METSTDYRAEPAGARAASPPSAASWSAIIAGAFAAGSVSIILLTLGAGLGFAAISPWATPGAAVKTFAVTAAIWLIVTQWLSSGVGGYIAGRLRTRWHGTHAHEVFFRDTAHGFVTWCVATLLVAALLAAFAVSGIGAGARAVSGAAREAAQDGGYGVDKLFRGGGTGAASTGPSPAAPASGDPRLEAAHILTRALQSGGVSPPDKAYLAELVSARTGVPQAEAQQRVDEFFTAATEAETKIKADADSARKAAAHSSIYTALSLLVGAFIASVSAALGGRLRDQHI